MKRINLYLNTDEQIPIGSAAVADSYFLRLRGLIGRSAEEIGGLLISPCSQIHTYFMSEPIDVVYLNKTGLILKVDDAVQKNRFCAPVRGAKRVLELPAGRAKSLGISEGLTLSWTKASR